MICLGGGVMDLRKNRGKMGKLCLLLFILIQSIFGISCQPTPEVPPVVSRSEGIPKDAISQLLKPGETKLIDAPEHWKERMERGNGRVTIEADIDLALPVLGNTPVIEMKRKQFEDEQLLQLVLYFVGNQKLFEPSSMTKDQLKKLLNKIETADIKYSPYQGRVVGDKQVERLKELITSAPESLIQEKVYVKPQFTVPFQTEYQYVFRRSEDNLVTSEKNSFLAMVENSQNLYSYVQATSYNEKAGTTGCFKYSTGSCFDEEFTEDQDQSLEISIREGLVDEKKVEATKLFLQELKKIIGENTLSEEYAIKSANKVLEQLGVQDMGLEVCKKAVWLPEVSEWDLLNDIDWSTAKAAYTLTYYRNVDGLTAYQPGGGTIVNGLPETMYAPPFAQEVIKITLTDEGVQKFEWYNMAEVEKVAAENTKLLSFDKIKERLADHMLYSAVAGDNANGIESTILTFRYVISDIKLKTTYCDAFNNPDHAWLVPVWIFQMDWYLKAPGAEEILRSPQTIMINAIDGGYIAPGRETGVFQIGLE